MVFWNLKLIISNSTNEENEFLLNEEGIDTSYGLQKRFSDWNIYVFGTLPQSVRLVNGSWRAVFHSFLGRKPLIGMIFGKYDDPLAGNSIKTCWRKFRKYPLITTLTKAFWDY